MVVCPSDGSQALFMSTSFKEPTPISGFTLMEILVVLLLVGIIITMSTLSINTTGVARQVEEETIRFANLLDLASQEAILQAKEIGVSLQEEGYRFYVFDNQHWRLVKEDELLRPHQFLIGLQVEVLIEEQQISLGRSDAEEAVPSIILFSTGEITPFVILFKMAMDNTWQCKLSNAINGAIQVTCETTTS
jgi:general secretion pathway protein H